MFAAMTKFLNGTISYMFGFGKKKRKKDKQPQPDPSVKGEAEKTAIDGNSVDDQNTDNQNTMEINSEPGGIPTDNDEKGELAEENPESANEGAVLADEYVHQPPPDHSSQDEQCVDQDNELPISEAHADLIEVAASDAASPTKQSLFSRFKAGLAKTRDRLFGGIGDLFLGKKEIDQALLEELETQLLLADVGIEATTQIIDNLTHALKRKELRDLEKLQSALKHQLLTILAPMQSPFEIQVEDKPFVILVIGVNGAGKTTAIGKLAYRFTKAKQKVCLAAGDTFRAAAVEQLKVWGERNQVPVIAQHTGADSASVIFDALNAAIAKKMDVLIADTAGRLQNKSHLMDELAKISRVMKKIQPEAPHETLLVIDGTTGQNALNQVKEFDQMMNISGIAITKLDGTAKGGIVFAIAQWAQSNGKNIPIRFLGFGEKREDLREFDAELFVEALFSRH